MQSSREGSAVSLPEAPRVELVERSAEEDVRALGLLRVGLRQEDGRGAVVVAADLLGGERLSRAAVGVAHDRHVVAEIGERGEAAPPARTRSPAPPARGRRGCRAAPQSLDPRRPHRFLDTDQAGEALLRREPEDPARRLHRVEVGKCDTRAEAADEGPAREVLSGQVVRHRSVSPGWLSTGWAVLWTSRRERSARRP